MGLRVGVTCLSNGVALTPESSASLDATVTPTAPPAQPCELWASCVGNTQSSYPLGPKVLTQPAGLLPWAEGGFRKEL